MRLVTFDAGSGPCLGVVVDGGILNVPQACAKLEAPGPQSLGELLRHGASVPLQRLVDRARVFPELLLQEESVQLLPCVPDPGKILCVGLNYRTHAAEANMAVPTSPILFSKFNSALSGSGSEIALPAESRQVDYEAELAVIIGRRAVNVPVTESLQYVFGYCNANDLTARDLQFRTGQWLLGKTPDGFCPIGPYVVTADEVRDPDNLAIRCWVNGELRQEANTSDMIFSCAELISYISRYITLEPGDLILTGTPQGVVMGYPEERREQAWLKAGDTVCVEVEGLGRLVNHMRPPITEPFAG